MFPQFWRRPCHNLPTYLLTYLAAWLSGSGVAHINEFTLRQARLVLGWVTVSGFNFRCGTFVSVCDQPSRSTQPGHPFVGGRNKWATSQRAVTPCGWGVKAGIWFMCGWKVKLCDALVTHEPYLSVLEKKAYNRALYKFICLLYYTYFLTLVLLFEADR